MTRHLCLVLLALCSVPGCGSSSSDSPNGSGGMNTGTCPNLTGTWKVTMHCEASLVGASAAVTQTGCSLAFAAPFDGFTGTVSTAGEVTLSGPQSCTGTVSGSPVSQIPLLCTPGTCNVTLSKN